HSARPSALIVIKLYRNDKVWHSLKQDCFGDCGDLFGLCRGVRRGEAAALTSALSPSHASSGRMEVSVQLLIELPLIILYAYLICFIIVSSNPYFKSPFFTFFCSSGETMK